MVHFTVILAQCAMVYVIWALGNGTVVCMLCPKINTSWGKLAPTGRHGRYVFATLIIIYDDNNQVTALATGCSLVLYDGSPLHPHTAVMWDLVDRWLLSLSWSFWWRWWSEQLIHCNHDHYDIPGWSCGASLTSDTMIILTILMMIRAMHDDDCDDDHDDDDD